MASAALAAMVGDHCPTAEDLFEDAAVRGVVIDHQDPHPVQTGGFGGSRLGGLRSRPGRGGR